MSIEQRKLYVGNIGDDVQEDDIVQLFGINFTPSLRQKCSVELKRVAETDERYAVLIVPTPIFPEMIKLDGCDLSGRQLFIKEIGQN